MFVYIMFFVITVIIFSVIIRKEIQYQNRVKMIIKEIKKHNKSYDLKNLKSEFKRKYK